MRPMLFLFLLITSSASAKVLIVTVAQVKSHVITSREIQIHNQVKAVLDSTFEDFKAEKTIEEVIREWLLFFEASTFYNSNIQAGEVDSLTQKALSKLIQVKKWKSLGVSKSELREKVARRLEADRIFVFKKKASVLPVSMGEIESEYNQNRIRYGNQSFDEVKEKIRSNRVKENLDNRLSQWFIVLEKKYKVQRFSNFNDN